MNNLKPLLCSKYALNVLVKLFKSKFGLILLSPSLLLAQEELTATKIVIDTIETKTVQIVNTIPDGKVWEDDEEWYKQTQILQVGEIPGQPDIGIFQFHDIPASNLHEQSLTRFWIEDRGFIRRYVMDANTGGATSFSMYDSFQERIFSVYHNNNTYLTLQNPTSYVTIGGAYESLYSDYKLIVKDGSAIIEDALTVNGNVRIGTTTDPGSDYKFAVGGHAIMEELKVALQGTTEWPDYVFEKNYKLPTLKEVEKHIKKKGHLENIPSAKEVQENGGINVGEMNAKLLQKIEELTLYTIEQEKMLEILIKRVESLEKTAK